MFAIAIVLRNLDAPTAFITLYSFLKQTEPAYPILEYATHCEKHLSCQIKLVCIINRLIKKMHEFMGKCVVIH
jgi:hypothetical protein